MLRKETIQIGGKDITLEMGEIARQADGAVIIRQGDTIVLVAVVADKSENVKQEVDFFPLTVEYREKSAAAGLFPGGFVKRESRPQEHEILASRIVDRSIRPLFPEGFCNEVQIMATVLSYDKNAEPELLSIMGTSAALYLSDIPWNGPVAGIRLVYKNGKMYVLPNEAERENAEMDIVMSCGKNGLVMLEGIANETQENVLCEAIQLAQTSMAPFFDLLERWDKENPVSKRKFASHTAPDEVKKALEEMAVEPLKAAMLGNSKKERADKVKAVCDKTAKEMEAKFPAEKDYLPIMLEDLKYRLFREYMFKESKRVDGRTFEQIRPISGKVSWLPRCHGSSLFTRGETQAMVTCTLGTSEDEQIIDTLNGEVSQKFMLHYNFPPYSVGEIKALHGPGRREIGHGFLATRALQNILPAQDAFPYTIRLVSDISESNGSSSMASVCGGCLALMDAGVPIKRPAAGVAMGLLKEGDKMLVISDIMGEEDHLGDMDFKVAGTEAGITAVQMDNKIGSLPPDVMAKALEQARQSRLFILGEMKKILPETRKELSLYAPRVNYFRIRKERVRDLIGSGGKTIQELQEVYKVKIDVDSLTGKVHVYSYDQTSTKKVMERIRYLTGEIEVGKYYKAEVTSVKEFGAFVKVFTNVEGLIHISEIAPKRIDRVTDILREGDQVVVKVLGVDRQGKIKFSRKDALHVSEEEIEN